VAVCEDHSLTYKELDRRSLRVAKVLLSNQVKPGDIVAVLDERGIDLLVTMVALIRFGFVYLPLDPMHPSTRWSEILKEANPAKLLVGKALLKQVNSIASDLDSDCILSLEDINNYDLGDNLITHVPSSSPNMDDLAYILFTSGSTGRPKGVMIDHRGMINNMRSKFKPLDLSDKDIIAQTASQCFDISVWQFLTAPLLGARIVIIPNEITRDPKTLVEQLNTHSVTIWEPVPSMLNAVVALNQSLTDLRWVLSTGEALTEGLVQRWMYRYPNFPIMNAYGPAECSDDVAFEPILNATDLVCIGRPVANARLHVLDQYQKLLPIGVVGELGISGPVVGQGYLGRDDLTKKAFIQNPYAQDKLDTRLYLTGDLVKRLGDGRIQYIGRTDSQVKVRGFRIELGEIEFNLNQYPGIHDSVVVVNECAENRKILVAYHCSKEVVNSDSLKNWLKNKLPDYMVPNVFVCLEEFPLSANGKIDRKLLSESPVEIINNTDYVKPDGHAEETMAAIWEELLDVEQVGGNHNFFDLGGHSLLIVSLIEKLRIEGYLLEARNVFVESNLSELCKTLKFDDQKTTTSTYRAPPNLIPEFCEHISPDMLTLISLEQSEIDAIINRVPGGAANVQDIYPLAPLQEGILFHHLLNEEGDTYITRLLLKLDSWEKLDSFIAAFQKVIDRHDILRTAVLWEDLSQPLQVVYRHAKLQYEEIELDKNREVLDQFNELMAPDKLHIDLQCAPLMKLRVAQDPNSDLVYVFMQEHHLISDHVSTEVELSEIQAFLSDEAAQLPTPIAYREFVAHTLEQCKQDDARNYFCKVLGDIDEPTAPFGLLDVRNDGSQFKRANTRLSDDLSKTIRSIARNRRVSPASLFHLAWALVIAKTSGRTDVVFGTVVSGRLQGTIGADRMLGMFINLLPLRVSLDKLSVSEALSHTQSALIDLLKFEQTPLAEAQRCSGLPAATPVFSSMLNYRHNPIEDKESESEKQAWEGIDSIFSDELTNYPFEVSIDDSGDHFEIEAYTDSSINPENVVGYMYRAVEGIVSALSTDKSKELLAFSIIGEDEKHHILHECNSRSIAYSGALTIQERIEAQVSKYPEADAVISGNTALSYSELNSRSNQLACYLRELDVERNTLVGIYADRSIDFVIAVLAILKAGGAYVPLDPSNPVDRLQMMVEDAELEVILTESSKSKELHKLLTNRAGDAQDVTCFCMDTDMVQLSAYDTQNLPTVNQFEQDRCDDYAYMIFTSGSTGKPKGALVHHAGALNHIDAEFDLLGFSSTYGESLCLNPHNFLQSAASSSDVSVWQMLAPLVSGGKTVILDEMTDIPRLVELLQSESVHLVQTAPVVLQLLLNYLQSLPKSQSELPNLKWLMIIAEACPVSLVNAWLTQYPSIPVMNGFGPTEASDDITYEIIREPLDETLLNVPIGKPIPNMTMYVLDDHQQVLPIGVPGELCVAGVGVGPGYWNDEKRTAECFLNNPYADKHNNHGARLYRTGDLGRWHSDGSLEFMGRLDNQVKVRGFRVELGEIEAVLTNQVEVAESAVLAHKNEQGDNRLTAYVVLQKSLSCSNLLTETDIKERVKAELPAYMVPSSVILLDKMPLNAADKIDRQRLPAPSQQVSDRTYAAPEGKLEALVATIWSQILDVDRVGRWDNFFDLGGHSLLIMRLIESLRQQGYRLSARCVFDTPNLAELATTIKRTDGTSHTPANKIELGCEQITPDDLPLVNLTQEEIDHIVSTVPGGIDNVQDIYPLAPLQEGLLFHHMMGEESDAYVISTLLTIDTRADVEQFLAAVRVVMKRHDILRTSVVWQGLGTPVQVVYREVELPVEEFVLRTDEEEESQLNRMMDVSGLTMDLEQAPLKRVQIAQSAENGYWYVLLQEHHIIGDHVSLELEIAEIQAVMGGKLNMLGTPTPYREFVAHTLKQREENDAEAFFTSRLADIDEPTAPFGLMDVFGDGSQVEEAVLDLEQELAQRVRDIARNHSVSAASFFHLAWALVVSQCSGRNDVVFGTMVSGRLQGTAGADSMLGMFINQLPLRLSLEDASVLQLLEHTHNELVELLDYEQTSLAIAQRCSSVPGSLPLYTSMINYRHGENSDYHDFEDNSEQESTLAGLDNEDSLESVDLVHIEENSNLPFALSVDDYGKNGFSLECHAAKSIGASAVNAYVMEAVKQLVNAIESQPDRLIASLNVLDHSHAHQLLIDFNDTRKSHPTDKLAHACFEEQVQLRGEHPALEFEGKVLTYQELNERANQLAHYLIEQGVEPEKPVAVYMPRCTEMVIALLAIFKSGGTYLPIDPSYPQERCDFMLEDTNPLLVISVKSSSNRVTAKHYRQLVLDSEDVELENVLAQPVTNPGLASVRTTPENSAYIIYTSGSTGKPKGVVVEHRNLLNYIYTTETLFGFSPTDRVMQFCSICFDVSIQEMFGALSHGSTLILREENWTDSVSEFWAHCRRIDLTVLSVPTAYWHVLNEEGVEFPENLRLIIMGGEKVNPEKVKQWFSINTDPVKVINVYGPTEATIGSCARVLTLNNLNDNLIGRPLDNEQIYIVDQSGRPTPIGVAGEMLIAGACVARGYLNRPELTDEKYIDIENYPNIIDFTKTQAKFGNRVYKTGDVGAWSATGEIQYLGRNDSQVKVRGYRIELGEIENVLSSFELVEDVIVVTAKLGEQLQIVAYLISNLPTDNYEEHTNELKQFIKTKLPAHAIPSAFVWLDEFPMLPNGKIDRSQLPNPGDSQSLSTEYVPPRDSHEKTLCEIWQEILNVPRVGRNDNFFELGGHSLIATQLVLRIQQEFDLTIRLRELYELGSLAELTTHLKMLMITTRDNISTDAAEDREVSEI